VRMPRYLSPTSIKMWEANRDQFYLYYLSDLKPARDPQTPPMAVGSAFDAYVKSFLVERLLGKRPEFEFKTIFEAQVEPHNRDEALGAGKAVFDFYSRCGALSDILLDLQGCIGQPKFEASIEGYISPISGLHGDVPLLGKPDIFFLTKNGARVIFDWKVNGYYSKQGISPHKWYARIRPGGECHKDCWGSVHRDQGIMLCGHKEHSLCRVEPDWSAQCSIYAWLLGESVGSDFIVAIDQIACRQGGMGMIPSMRVAQHRSRITPEFQEALYRRAHYIWYQIQTGHIFDNLPRASSDARCKMLDEVSQQPVDDAFNDLVR